MTVVPTLFQEPGAVLSTVHQLTLGGKVLFSLQFPQTGETEARERVEGTCPRSPILGGTELDLELRQPDSPH